MNSPIEHHLVHAIGVLLCLSALAFGIIPTRVTRPTYGEAERVYQRLGVEGEWATLKEFRRLAERNELDALGWQRLGLLLYGVGDFKSALGAFFRSVELDRDLTRSWRMIEDVLSTLGRRDEASQASDQYTIAAFVNEFDQQIRCASSDNDWEGVLRAARRYRTEHPGQVYEVTALCHEVVALAELGRLDELGAQARQAVFECRVTTAMVPAISGEEDELTGRAIREAWNLEPLATELATRADQHLGDIAPWILRPTRIESAPQDR